ncbi:hypothetical protein [Acidithiobacillus sp.]|uniref:helix-turn-helix domain-containing protein n=1 Tax=Acidithiobacillus sp. TaxID=1872118 RepID=UPI0025BA4CBA|nr:hypothetical protein [Acidithiobacillus sp.]MCK9189339.1 hypothetical protein [Acidithiobacillus sp.]MCK9359069.1 hypothetical protein [Acidithiobacillus sp.]
MCGTLDRILDPDVKAIRETRGRCQSQFAAMIGVKLNILQNWERKRVRPAGPVGALIQIVATDSHAVIRALYMATQHEIGCPHRNVLS